MVCEGMKSTFISAADGLEISYLETAPEGTPKGIVQLVHGMCEHKERYLPLMDFLNRRGYVCVINDHRGHGESVREPEDLGYFYEGGAEGLVEDVHQLLVMTREKYGRELPYTLLGHSMGSFAVRVFLKEHDADIDRLIVMGSPSPLAASGAGLVLCRLIGKMKGDRGHSALLDTLVMDSQYEKRFAREHTRHSWISSDRAVVEAYNKDPLCSFTFTVSGYEQLIRLMQETYSPQGWLLHHPDLPILFLSGKEDPCAVSPKAFGRAVKFLRQTGYRQVTGYMYPGMRHEILNEKEKARVYHDIIRFLEGQQPAEA